MTREALAHENVQVLQPDQFDEVWWQAVHKALNEVPRMFQIWACKQVTGVAGTNEMQARYIPLTMTRSVIFVGFVSRHTDMLF